ncbi:MAG: hypothetical protein ACFBSF_19955 [Leptolyngbyaceae cyanobacterium]
MANLVRLELSKKQISFQPDNFKDFSRTENQPEAGDFQVTVVNLSDRFSSFQIELEVGDQKQGQGEQWYRVEPNICAKKPPGDRTTFTVTLLKAPVRSYDITIPVTVRVVSIEVAELTGEAIVFLKVQRPRKTLHAYLPIEDLTVYPGDRCKIPVLVYNLNSAARKVSLRLKGIDLNWLPEGTEQTIHLDSGESGETVFWCAPPPISSSRHKVYPLLLEVFDDKGNTASAQGTLEVLPFGQVVLTCDEPTQRVPPERSRRPSQTKTLQFDLTLHNQSNLGVCVNLKEEPAGPKRVRSQLIDRPATLTLEPDALDETAIPVEATRPWLGTPRTEAIEVLAALTWPGSGEAIQQVPVQPSTQRLDVKLLPLIPFWLQIGGGLLALFLTLLGWWLWPRPHHSAPVTALTLMANGNTVISGSSDQTLRNWQVNPESWLPDMRRLKSVSVLTDPPLGKSVRTLRHLPAEVDRLAVGLENGEIQIWDIAERSSVRSFFEESRPDRVFALDFTEDSRLLFSGHGSGQVRLWNMAGDSESPLQRLYPPRSFAIAAVTAIEQPERYQLLAIGGQFNRLVLWAWDEEQAFNIDYSVDLKAPSETAFTPVVSRQSYLTSLAGADGAAIMASADTQGFITLWNMDELYGCMSQASSRLSRLQRRGSRSGASARQRRDIHGNIYATVDVAEDCATAVLDQWQAVPNGQAVRSVALTENGCYLSSVGDDGRVILWPLSETYQRATEHAKGMLLQRLPRANLNVVDIHRDTARNQEDTVLVAHDIPGNRVRVHRRQVKRNGCQ